MDLKIKGKLALVSGSTAGIGFAIASQLAAEGARVIVNGRSQQAVQAGLRDLDDAALFQLLSDPRPTMGR